MLKPKKVSRALLIGNKKLLDQTVEALHDLSCVHIEDFTEETDFLSIGRPAEVASDVSNKLIKLRSLSNFLKIKPKYVDSLLGEEYLLNEFDAKLDEMEYVVSDLLARRSALENEGKDIDTYIEDLQPLSLFPLNVEMYSGYKSISARAGYIKGESTDIETEIKNITTHCELSFVTHNKANIVALFSPVEYTGAINEILDKYNFSELHIPELTGEPGKLLAGFKNRKDDLQSELE